MNKLIALAVFLILVGLPGMVHAQTVTSTSVTTKVGNPTGPGPGTAPPGQGPSGFKYYCQGNKDWVNYDNIGQEGCGPTAFAIAVSNFGVIMDPKQVDDALVANGFRSGGGVTNAKAALFSDWFSKLGLAPSDVDLVSGNALDVQTAKKFLDQGYLILAAANRYHCGAGCGLPNDVWFNHVFVINSVDTSTNTFTVLDPSNCYYSGNAQYQGNVQASTGQTHPAAGEIDWFYAYAYKKK